jgi:anti-sigma regulatory factor (Ser/Thr protein kinase)
LERSFRISATPDAAQVAREALDGWVNERLGAVRGDDARLCASELVSNVVRHGNVPTGGNLTLGVHANDSTVTISVEQPTSASLAQVRELSDDREGGFGLRLVDALADSWGVEGEAPGNVWFTMSRDART